MNSIQIYKKTIIILSTYAFATFSDISYFQIDKCNTQDTLINSIDTIIKKYICKSGGRREIAHKKNGKYDGLFTSWSSSGIKLEEFSYIDNKFDGEMKGWDTTGALVSHRFYQNGIPVGEHQDFYSIGKPKKIVNYNTSGLKHGLSESWREDGTRKDSIVYINGEILEERVYFSNGKPRIWAKCNGEMVTATAAFPDGSKLDKNVNPVIEAEYYSLKTGKIISTVKNGNGKAIYYSEDGLSRYFCEYNNGVSVNLRELTSNEFPDKK